MLKSLELLRNGYRGLTSASSSAQSLSQDLKQAQSELKKSILKKVQEVTNGIPQQPIILSVVGQALATTNEKDLLRMIRLVHMELEKILDEFDDDKIVSFKIPANTLEVNQVIPVTPALEIGEHRIEAVKFID